MEGGEGISNVRELPWFVLLWGKELIYKPSLHLFLTLASPHLSKRRYLFTSLAVLLPPSPPSSPSCTSSIFHELLEHVCHCFTRIPSLSLRSPPHHPLV